MAMFGKKTSAVSAPAGAAPQADVQFSAAPVPEQAIARSVLIPAVSTMIADGDVSEFELAQISNLCMFSPIYLPLGGEKVQMLVKDIIDEISTDGHPETIKRAAEMLSPALRETALCFAMRVALADGHVDEGEKNSLSQTGYFMGIEPAVFDNILSVVAMMQRPATA